MNDHHPQILTPMFDLLLPLSLSISPSASPDVSSSALFCLQHPGHFHQPSQVAQTGGGEAKRSAISSTCAACQKHVHLVQRFLVDGKLYHRNCFRYGTVLSVKAVVCTMMVATKYGGKILIIVCYVTSHSSQNWNDSIKTNFHTLSNYKTST